jgi:hypothetical protein
MPRSPGQGLESTPYDFILNAKSSKTPSTGGVKGGPKLLYVAIGGVLLVVVLFIVLSLGKGSGNSQGLVSIAEQQTELARVAALNSDQLTSESTMDYAITTQLSMITAQQTLLSYLKANGVTIDPSKLAQQATDPRTDAALTAAQSNGSLDSAMTSELTTELERYNATLRSVYQQSSSPTTQALLKGFFDDSNLLLELGKTKASI